MNSPHTPAFAAALGHPGFVAALGPPGLAAALGPPEGAAARGAPRGALRHRLAPVAALCAALCCAPPAAAGDTTLAAQLARWSAQAGAPGDAGRGAAFFTRTHGRDGSCASCHGERPVRPGRHASTGKAIDPLAPAANPSAFTDSARVDKWFRRNCRDVLGRECSPGEKADVLAWLATLEP